MFALASTSLLSELAVLVDTASNVMVGRSRKGTHTCILPEHNVDLRHAANRLEAKCMAHVLTLMCTCMFCASLLYQNLCMTGGEVTATICGMMHGTQACVLRSRLLSYGIMLCSGQAVATCHHA